MPFDSHVPPPADARSVLPVALRGLAYAVDGKRLIDGLDLTIAAGAPTAVMGANGAGKSLMLRLIMGLIQPTAGSIAWGGGMRPSSARRRVAMVFQRPVLLRRSVAGNLGHALKASGVPSAARAGRIARLLELAQLGEMSRRPARVLSGGEQQRLAVVRALASEPELLLLDEPTANLDPQSTAAIEAIVAAAQARGAKVVMVTHDAGQARRIAGDVVFLHRGRVTEHSPAAEFFDRPASAAGRAYLDGRLLV